MICYGRNRQLLVWLCIQTVHAPMYRRDATFANWSSALGTDFFQGRRSISRWEESY